MKLRKNENGSITLEAAIVMPIFILFLVFLTFLIKFALVDIAINKAVSETTKQISTQAYPVNEVAQGAAAIVTENEKYQEIMGSITELEDDLKSAIGDDNFDEFVVDPAKEAGEYVLNSAASAVLTGILRNYLTTDEAADNDFGFIDVEEFEVTSAKLTGENNQYIEVIAQYKIVLPIPFIENEFWLEKKAYERLWLGS